MTKNTDIINHVKKKSLKNEEVKPESVRKQRENTRWIIARSFVAKKHNLYVSQIFPGSSVNEVQSKITSSQRLREREANPSQVRWWETWAVQFSGFAFLGGDCDFAQSGSVAARSVRQPLASRSKCFAVERRLESREDRDAAEGEDAWQRRNNPTRNQTFQSNF